MYLHRSLKFYPVLAVASDPLMAEFKTSHTRLIDHMLILSMGRLVPTISGNSLPHPFRSIGSRLPLKLHVDHKVTCWELLNVCYWSSWRSIVTLSRHAD